ncbi:MAG: fumarylacetoacetate hydrolase family protein [Alphaproteobacteria bacterium]|nr:fumarylacetoacetate hydrolase family protein [Alphaproteobacteria bacterium]
MQKFRVKRRGAAAAVRVSLPARPAIQGKTLVKLLTYKSGKALKVGVVDDGKVLDLAKAATAAGKAVPATLRGIVEGGSKAMTAVKAAVKYAKANPKGLYTALDKITYAAPIQDVRKNVFCVGRNYKLHIEEMARAMNRPDPNYPKVPEFFTKPPTTIVAHEAPVERHANYTKMLDYEAELAIIIGKGGRNIPASKALNHIFGYTIVNDVTARDAQRAHGQFFKGKSFDTFCPIGPWIVTKDEFGEPGGHKITLKVNGKIRQDSNTSDLYHGVPAIIEALSGALTLEAGDIIATGTPSGVAAGMTPPVWLKTGDVMEVEIAGIGVLRNKIVA